MNVMHLCLQAIVETKLVFTNQHANKIKLQRLCWQKHLEDKLTGRKGTHNIKITIKIRPSSTNTFNAVSLLPPPLNTMPLACYPTS